MTTIDNSDNKESQRHNIWDMTNATEEEQRDALYALSGGDPAWAPREPVEPSLLADVFLHEIMEEHGPAPKTREEVTDFLKAFAARFAGELTPTPEEWQRIKESQRALDKKLANQEQTDSIHALDLHHPTHTVADIPVNSEDSFQ